MNSVTNKINFIKQIIASKNISLIHKTIKPIFDFDTEGLPNEVNNQILYCAQQELKKLSADLAQELMFKRFYQDSEIRYAKYIASNMIQIKDASYLMGTDSNSAERYLGEEPQHTIQLTEFAIGKTVITQEIYQHMNPILDIGNAIDTEPNMPVVNVSWYDAVMFAAWVDCRLPTEAEWEYACKGGTMNHWCCTTENELESYAWYSHNSDGYVHAVATLKPNHFGLYDMHGNVWEWCLDSYTEDYYSNSPKLNPVNNQEKLNKVCRGGSMHAFAEMCRSSFRYNESPDFKATDIGFRLVKS